MLPAASTHLTLRLIALGLALLWGLSAADTSRVGLTRQTTASAAGLHGACNGLGGQAVARTELFFGLARPDGKRVSAAEFQAFVDQEITPRFPAGLTLLPGDGQFRNTAGVMVKENAKLLILLYPQEHGASQKIEAIRAAYMKTFAQQSVMRVDGLSCMS